MEEHNIIFDLRNLRSGIGKKKLLQKIYVVYDDVAYEYIVIPTSANMQMNENNYMYGVLSPACSVSDIECNFVVEHYRMINKDEIPFDGVIVDKKVVEKIIEKEKIVKEYYNIYSFIS